MSAPVTEALAPVLEGEVLGFRQWNVNEDLQLESMGMSAVWVRGVNHAVCSPPGSVGGLLDGRHARHAAPHTDCDCGIYALHGPTFWYGRERRSRSFLFGPLSRGGLEPVAGLVQGWGRIEVHAEGFRAEFAKVVAIAVPERLRDAVIARAVAAEYRVPAVPQGELERLASEFGSTIGQEHRPEPVPDRDRLTFTFASPSLWSSGASFDAAMRANLRALMDKQFLLGTADAKQSNPPAVEELHPAGPKVPAAVAKARAARPQYDPRAFVPKRKGGLR